MATLIITEKASQAKDLRAALGARFGQILPAEGHLLRLAEPEEVHAAWKSWSCVVLKPEGLYPTRPAAGGNKPAKLKAIAAALGAVGFDAVKQLAVARIENRPARLDLSAYPYLPAANVATTQPADYLALLSKEAA
jgi:hypothetical protein